MKHVDPSMHYCMLNNETQNLKAIFQIFLKLEKFQAEIIHGLKKA